MTERTITVWDYDCVAEARGHRVLFFRRFGSYQGDWVMLSLGGDHFYIWRGSYGSCSGCDSLEADPIEGETLAISDGRLQAFAREYAPFLEMEKAAALAVALREDSLLPLLPANERWDEYDDVPAEQVGQEFASIVRAEIGVIRPVDIMRLSNLETRRLALERFGARRFVEKCSAILLDDDGPNGLYRAEGGPEPFVFLFLQDSSTPRQYVLRVPPEMTTVKQALAWSFDVDNYAPATEA